LTPPRTRRCPTTADTVPKDAQEEDLTAPLRLGMALSLGLLKPEINKLPLLEACCLAPTSSVVPRRKGLGAVRLADDGGVFGKVSWPSEVIALPVGHIELSQSAELVVGLNAFGGDCRADLVTE
jgi:hypothetical protein